MDRTNQESERERESYWIRYLNALRPYGISRGNQSSLVRACDSLCETFCSCNFPESMRKWGPFALSIGEKHSVWRVRFMAHCILYCVYGHSGAGLGGSVGCAVRLETRRSRVQPPPRSATFFRGDWSWNIFYGHSLPSADSRRAVVSFWRKNVHNTG